MSYTVANLWQMPPPLPRNDLADCSSGHSVLCSENFLSFSVGVSLSDFQDGGVIEFSCARAFASSGTPLRDHISAVVSRRSEKEMIYSDATGVVALVANEHPIRDSSVFKLPCPPVCIHMEPTLNSEISVPVLVLESCPFPAVRTSYDLLPKAILSRLHSIVERRSISPLVHTVGRTKSITANQVLASIRSALRSLPSRSAAERRAIAVLSQVVGITKPALRSVTVAILDVAYHGSMVAL